MGLLISNHLPFEKRDASEPSLESRAKIKALCIQWHCSNKEKKSVLGIKWADMQDFSYRTWVRLQNHVVLYNNIIFSLILFIHHSVMLDHADCVLIETHFYLYPFFVWIKQAVNRENETFGLSKGSKCVIFQILSYYLE